MARHLKKKEKILSKSNRQLFGFVLLLLVFSILLYTTFILYTEGKLFKEQVNDSLKPKQDTGMTSVSIIYKNTSISKNSS